MADPGTLDSVSWTERYNNQIASRNEVAMKTQKILIRDETKYDAAVITEVTVAAFESLEISNHTEQFILEALRSAGQCHVP